MGSTIDSTMGLCESGRAIGGIRVTYRVLPHERCAFLAFLRVKDILSTEKYADPPRRCFNLFRALGEELFCEASETVMAY
jgi:hypothetical protein